jgi:hyperosmotically inducible protein
MFQSRQWIVATALLILVPPAAVPAIGEQQTPSTATKTAKKAPKPPAKAAKPAAKPGAKAAARKPGPLRPSDLAETHRPPASMPAPSHSQFEVPQAKSLAETPDVVLNSRVRASLISALSGGAGQDITPNTSKGVVTLTGSVKTKQLRARAEQVAQKVHGVRGVKNRLIVK